MISVVRMSVLGRVFLGCDILQCRSHPCTNDNGAVDDEDDGEGVVEERCQESGGDFLGRLAVMAKDDEDGDGDGKRDGE